MNERINQSGRYRAARAAKKKFYVYWHKCSKSQKVDLPWDSPQA